MEDAKAQKFEAGATVHLALDEFETVDLPLNVTLMALVQIARCRRIEWSL
jgi:hypothetical protein